MVVELRNGVRFRPLGRRARADRGVQHAEAGSRSVCSFVPHECDTLLAVRVESPSSRVQRVFSQNSPARSLHGLHDARCVENSQNSVGEGVARRRGFCELGGTKTSRTSTRGQFSRPVVEELAPVQQASGSMHEEAWAGCNECLSLKISQEVEIVPVCAVTMSYLPPPFIAPVPPAPGKEVRSWIGWTPLVKGRGYGGSRVP